MVKSNPKLWIIIGIIIVIIVIGGIWYGVSRNPVGKETIKIGALLPLTGNAAIYGESMRQGTELAAEQINKLGGLNGKKVEIVFEDSKGEAKEAVTTFSNLNGRVPVAITAISSVVLSIAPLANEQKTVLMNVGAKNPKISQAGDYVFSIIPNSDFDEKVFADFVKKNLTINKIAIIRGNNDYGIGTSDAFEKFFVGANGIIVAKETYENDATDFRTQLTKIKSTQPEGIFMVGYKEQGSMLKQAYELGINAKWLAPEGFAQPEIIEIAGIATEGVIYHAPGLNPDSVEEPAKSFFVEYPARFGKQPDIYAANSYDAVRLLAQAISEFGNNSEKIKEWLYNVKDWPSVSGKISFDSNGDVIKSISIMTVKNGQFVPYGG